MFSSGSPSGDWMTIGEVVSKTAKMSSQGTSYTIWRLRNLSQGGSILLLLFGGAHHAFWREPQGEIVRGCTSIFHQQRRSNQEIGRVGGL